MKEWYGRDWQKCGKDCFRYYEFEFNNKPFLVDSEGNPVKEIGKDIAVYSLKLNRNAQ